MKNQNTASLSRKLFSSFIISFLVPMVLVNCIVSYLFIARQYREINQQAENNKKLISAYMTKYINDIDNITKAPYYHSYFQSKSSLDSLSPYDQNQISKEIGQLLQLTTYSREDFGDLVVMSDNHVLYFNSIDWYQYLPTVNPLNSREWYTAAVELGCRIAIVPSDKQESSEGILHTDSFYISRKLNNIFSPEQTNIIMVNLKTDALENLFSSLTSAAPLMILFTNNNGQLIYSDTDVDKGFVDSLTSPKLTFNHKTWNHYSQDLEDYPLTVHVLLSSSYITRQISTFMMTSFLCYMAGVCIAYILFKRNNQWIKQPTYHIKSTLKELESGNLTARCHALPVLEFNEIGSSVNAMAFQLQEKIKNEYELSIAQKNLQFQALQSQIQPHFIINTIYSFITLNQIGEQELLNNSFYSFAHLLRYVLSKDSNTTIGRELEFLNDYCCLCLLRFGNRLSYEIQCPDNLREQGLPKLIMQPLVENAVIHGIEPSEVPCRLEIHVEECTDTLYIMIEDNGVGFTGEQLNSPNSIGIKNVENRISIWNPAARLYIYRINGSTIQVIAIPQTTYGGSEL
ncbi:sensor histidine kinase [Lacrimispora brassicae]